MFTNIISFQETFRTLSQHKEWLEKEVGQTRKNRHKITSAGIRHQTNSSLRHAKKKKKKKDYNSCFDEGKLVLS